MTARRHIPAQDETELDMTPMLDIVFIMLIFFIVTTSFVKESGVTVNTPQAQTTAQQERANIFIAIKASGEIWIDRRPVDPRSVRTTRAARSSLRWWLVSGCASPTRFAISLTQMGPSLVHARMMRSRLGSPSSRKDLRELRGLSRI